MMTRDRDLARELTHLGRGKLNSLPAGDWNARLHQIPQSLYDNPRTAHCRHAAHDSPDNPSPDALDLHAFLR